MRKVRIRMSELKTYKITKEHVVSHEWTLQANSAIDALNAAQTQKFDAVWEHKDPFKICVVRLPE